VGAQRQAEGAGFGDEFAGGQRAAVADESDELFAGGAADGGAVDVAGEDLAAEQVEQLVDQPQAEEHLVAGQPGGHGGAAGDGVEQRVVLPHPADEGDLGPADEVGVERPAGAPDEDGQLVAFPAPW
jgi:hypothetical protein